MAFFDDFKKTVTELGQGASQKTKSFTDGVKINNQISDQKKKLSKMYEDLGRMLCHEETVRSNPNCAQLLGWIEQGERNRKALEQQLSVAKGAVICRNCGAMVAQGNAFCQNCGTKVEIAQPQGNPNVQQGNANWQSNQQSAGQQENYNSQPNQQPAGQQENYNWQPSQPQGEVQSDSQPQPNGSSDSNEMQG